MPADPSRPSFSIDKEISINITIPQTDAVLTDQGYTYNQAGFTYNQPGVFYGGVSQQNQDISPIILTASQVIPTATITDIYTPFVPPPKNSGVLIGILGLTYP